MDRQIAHSYQRNTDEHGPARGPRPGKAGNGNNPNGNDPQKRGTYPLRVFLLGFATLALLVAGLLFLNGQPSDIQNQPVGELPYSSFYQQVMHGNVESATFQGQDITGQFRHAISLMDSQSDTVLTNQYHLTQLPSGDPELIPLLNKY